MALYDNKVWIFRMLCVCGCVDKYVFVHLGWYLCHIWASDKCSSWKCDVVLTRSCDI